MFKSIITICCLLALTLFAQSAFSATFTFTDKHIYTTNYSDTIVNEYDATGNWISSIDMGSTNSLDMIKGISFGRDNLLYAVVRDTSDITKVVAFNALGQIQATYVHPMSISGNLSLGKILLTNTHIFVAHGSGITKMTIGDESSATDIISTGFYDIALLASGNIVVAKRYNVFEYTQEGMLVSEYIVNNDNNIMSSTFFGYTNICGIAVDESKGVYYVSMLGTSSDRFPLLKINLDTHSIMDNVYVWYGDDIQILNNGNIVVGSNAQAPEIYTSDLSLVTTLGSDEQMFVTQLGGYVPPVLKPKNVISSYLFLLLK